MFVCKFLGGFNGNEAVVVFESVKIFGRDRAVGGATCTSCGKGRVEQDSLTC